MIAQFLRPREVFRSSGELSSRRVTDDGPSRSDGGNGAWKKRTASERVRDVLLSFTAIDLALARHSECGRLRAQLNEEGHRVFPEQSAEEARLTEECIRLVLAVAAAEDDFMSVGTANTPSL